MSGTPEITRRRLHTQGLAHPTRQSAVDVVTWLGAVQSQDHPAAKWAVGQRMASGTEADIQRAFDAGEIVRTHVMRPTWHYILPADLRWMQALTAHRVRALLASADRTLEIDAAERARANAAITQALAGGQHRTRAELATALAAAGIATEMGQRVGTLLMHAELDALICSGPMRGKQHTYALVDERAPQALTLSHDEALATLTERYLTSHGPAQVKDFSWWSGLTMAEAQAGVDLVGPRLAREVIDGMPFWRAASAPVASPATEVAYLLPNFDEFTVGYADRSLLYHARHAAMFDAAMNQLGHVMVLGSQLVGLWKRTLRRDTVAVTLTPASPLAEPERTLFAEAAQRYGDFLGLRVEVA